MSITSNLYPPLVNDTIPSFVRTTPCRIYFSLSNYNSAENIKNVQISLINQKTNLSAFDLQKYPSGIKISSLFLDSEKTGDYNYYIEIQPNDLKTKQFGINQFYKVQLRFTSLSAPEPPKKGIAQWLYNNRQYFSEWSKVCLIKGIEKPKIVIRSFEGMDEDNGNQETVLTTEIVDIIGQMYYSSGIEEKEYLKSYNIKIYYNNDLNTILFDSGQIYTNPYNPNEINYELAYDFTDGVKYTIIFTYITNNLYTDKKIYNFTVIQRGIDKLNANILATPDNENGRIAVNIISKNLERFLGNLTFRRTSSKSNFHRWEDIKTVTLFEDEPLNFTFYDTTIESGVWYKYCAQRRNARGDRGVIVKTDKAVMCLLEDMFLTKNNCQLKIKLNPSLNEFKYNVTESQQVTIGSQFPYIKRNGNNYFRTFPIGGLISSFIDTTNWYDPHFEEKIVPPYKFEQNDFKTNKNEIKAFSSKNEIYGEETQSLYEDYNNKNNINQYNDYIYEREFREKVYEFLYKHDVKLFRSTTEGNILIKLMNIDFQPIETLGRMLYSFTATAVEIDEANLKNYEKYGIQEIGTYQSYVNYEHTVLGQVRNTYTISKDAQGNPIPFNIIQTVIDKKYKNKASKGFINQVKYLQWLRLEISSDPYLIIETKNGLVKADSTSLIDKSKAILGYIVEINGKPIVIRPRIIRRTTDTTKENPITTYIGYFELKESNTQITSLKFMYQTTVTIDYLAHLQQIEDISKLARKIYYFKKQGQIFGNFQPQEFLYKKIYNKYLLNYKTYYQKLLDIIELKIEGNTNTVIYVKDSKDGQPTRHVLENGFLQLKEDEIYFESLYFCGRHLTECLDPLIDFIPQQGVYDKLSDIQNPVNGGIYQLKTYGFSSSILQLENQGVLLVSEDLIEKTVITPNNLYTLLLETIKDDDTLKFVYYQNRWYVLNEALEKIKLLQRNRYVRDTEFIATNEEYDTISDIKNPIQNGVYNIRKDSNQYIYYNNNWYLFTSDNDVLCPVDGSVNYYCEVVKGVY